MEARPRVFIYNLKRNRYTITISKSGIIHLRNSSPRLYLEENQI